VPEFVIQTLPPNSSDDWIREAIKATSIYFPLDKGPLIRLILDSSSEIPELVIVSHHTVCDGLSLAHFFGEILLHFGDREREFEPLPNVQQVGAGNLPPSASLSALSRMGINFFNKLWERKNIHFSAEDLNSPSSILEGK
jgi:NRPS condensation-like uncharacterized protein